jgi:hypothetical protein
MFNADAFDHHDRRFYIYSRKIVSLAWRLSLLASFLSSIAVAQSPAIQWKTLVKGLQQPAFAASARDGSVRMFIVEPGGTNFRLEPPRGNQVPGQPCPDNDTLTLPVPFAEGEENEIYLVDWEGQLLQLTVANPVARKATPRK